MVCVTVAAYWPALHGGFILDDDMLLTSNPSMKAPDGLYQIWFTTNESEYFPISYSSLWLEWRLWGMNPTGYHITNLALHIATALLIWLVLRRLFIPGAFLAALLFAVHPVNVESVAWIAQRRNTLAILFFILSILCYLRAEEGREDSAQGSWKYWYWLSLAVFVLAMFSKGSVAILPVVLLGLTLWQRRRINAADLLRTAPFFLAAIALTLVNIWIQQRGFDEAIRSASLAQRCAGRGAAVWFYLGKALMPINLVFIYPSWKIDAREVLWWLPLAAAVVATAVLFWKRDAGWNRHLLAAWLFFGVALSPILGFVDVGFMQNSLVADHYQHIALIAIVALVSAWIAWFQREPTRTSWVTGVIVALVGTLTWLTWRQNHLYASPLALYEATLENNPDSWLAHNNLGFELTRAGLREAAMHHFREALRLKPDYVQALDNLGVEMANSSRGDEAIQHYQQALNINPNDFATHINLGLALVQRGQLQAGMAHYEQALQLRPDNADAHNNWGVALDSQGKVQEAIAHFQEAIKLNPNFAEAHGNLGGALLKADRHAEAIEEFKVALQLRPEYSEAHANLAIALAGQGRMQEAIDHYQQALQINPNSLLAQNNLGNALARRPPGRSGPALGSCRAPATRFRRNSQQSGRHVGRPGAFSRGDQAVPSGDPT